MTTSVRSIIKRWPSVGERSGEDVFADDIGATVWAVRKWAWRGRIPSRWWLPVCSAASRRKIKGVTLEALARLDSEKTPGAAPALECTR